MDIDVIRIRNKKDSDPTRFYDFKAISDYFHFATEQGVPLKVALENLKALEEGKTVDGVVFGEPGIYLQGAKAKLTDHEVIVNG